MNVQLLQAQNEEHRPAAATAMLNGADDTSGREVGVRQDAIRDSMTDSPSISCLCLRTSHGSSAPSRNLALQSTSSIQTTSSIGVDSDADSPVWRANDVSVRVDLVPSVEEHGIQIEDSDSVEEELKALREQRAPSPSAHPLRTTTYRLISLDRIRDVPAAA